jgi:regulator of protease activity HflC (stomatin/prohibitin superfamily)
MKKNVIRCIAACFIGIILIGFTTGCGRVVPPGTTTVILNPSGKAEIKNQGVYYAFGRDKVYFVDSKLKSFNKTIKILCADEINMTVSVKWLGSFHVTKETIETIQKKVPAKKIERDDIVGYELSLDLFFKMAMEDILSSSTRDIISKYRTDNIRESRGDIQNAIKANVIKRLADLKYPVMTTDIMITNLDYPEQVTKMREAIKNAELEDQKKAAIAKANVAAAKRDAELAAEQGKAELVKAEAKAKANMIIAESLTPQILLLRQYETLQRLAEGENNTVIVLPFDALKTGYAEAMIQKDALEQVRKAK